jgi:predicted nicotinamide N-methyase
VEETVLLDGHAFRIRRPGEPDRLLDHPAVVAAFAKDEYMPYWADLWPAARMLAKVLLREEWPAGTEALELGCGLGLPGVAALARGLRVTFSDYDATALAFAAENARLNGFHEFRLLRLDWRRPPAVQYPLILASDLLYEERNVAPVVGLLQKMLTPNGLCLLTDQDRKPAPLLRAMLSEAGFSFTTEMVRAGQPGLRVKGTIYRIRKTSSTKV